MRTVSSFTNAQFIRDNHVRVSELVWRWSSATQTVQVHAQGKCIAWITAELIACSALGPETTINMFVEHVVGLCANASADV